MPLLVSCIVCTSSVYFLLLISCIDGLLYSLYKFTSYMPLLVSCIVCTSSVYFLYAPFGLLYRKFTICTDRGTVYFLYAPFGLLYSLYSSVYFLLPIPEVSCIVCTRVYFLYALLVSCIVCTSSVHFLYAPFGLLYSLYLFSSLPICPFWSLV